MSSAARDWEAVDYGKVAFRFVDRLSSLHTIDKIFEVTRETLSQFGFEWSALSSMPEDFESEQPQALLLERATRLARAL